MSKKNYKIAVCVSGGGRSLQNLIEAQTSSSWQVACVVSSSETCLANCIAEKYNLPLYVGNFSSKATASSLHDFLVIHKIDFIVLAGFLKLLPTFEDFTGRIINIHPALLPSYGGRGMHGIHVHRAVLAAKEKLTGATVHFVSEHYDEGKIISQIRVPVLNSDSEEDLAKRVFKAECTLLPITIEKLCQGSLPLPSGGIWHLEELV